MFLFMPGVENPPYAGECLNPRDNDVKFSVKIPTGCVVATFERSKMPRLYYADWKSKRFTGFSATWEWKYTNKSTSWYLTKYSREDFNKKFIRLVNLVHSLSSEPRDNMMEAAKQVKADYMNVMGVIDTEGNIISEWYDWMFEQLEEKINRGDYIYEDAYDESDVVISDETLETAAHMLLYLMAPPKAYWTEWYRTYDEWLNSKPYLKRLLRK